MLWIYTKPDGEPAFWSREARPGELDGYDPLTGRIIAYSLTDCERFDEDEPSPAHSAKIARAEREYRMKKEAF